MHLHTFRFMVLFLFATATVCYAARSWVPDAREKVEILKHLNRVNKHPVKSIKSPDDDIIDCVLISNQPAFDHPLLKNHTIKMKPSYYPKLKEDIMSSMMNASKVSPSSSSTITQLWHSNGKCPKETIPIRRTKMEDILRAGSVESYGKKKSFFVAQSNAGNRNAHEHATASTDGRFYGSKATMNVWNPKVQKDVNELSLGQLWLTAGPDSDVNTIEAGWENDGYRNTRCRNLDCLGFVQTNSEIAIGGSISPTSQLDGTQYDITIFVWKDSHDGNWWMQVGEHVVGYWPSSLFSYLSESASTAIWGGEVVNTLSDGYHTTTQMGSGLFPTQGQGEGRVSYFKNIQTLDETATPRTPESLKPFTTKETCYDIKIGMDEEWGSFFYYGGPGRNDQCIY